MTFTELFYITGLLVWAFSGFVLTVLCVIVFGGIIAGALSDFRILFRMLKRKADE